MLQFPAVMPQPFVRVIAVGIALVSLAARPAESQTSTALSGVVTDEMQGLVSGATVVLRDAQGAEQQKARTDRKGRYALEAVPNGNYVIEVTMPGFARGNDIVALSGGAMQRDVTLRLGQLTEMVTVKAADPSGPALLARNEAPSTAKCKEGFAPGGPGGAIEPPQKIRTVFPRYPEPLKSAQTKGRVVLHGIVGIDGAIRSLRVVTTTHAEFGTAAAEAISLWRYVATRLNCSPVDTVVRFDVVFEG